MPEIILRDESLRGVDYKLPYLQAIEEGAAGSTSYFRVPETFWSSGLCTDLSGAGLAMYLIAMSRAGWGNDPSFWLSPTLFRKEYGLGESTRKKGLKELVDRGVLTHELRSIDRNGESGHRRFVRSVYTIVSDYRAAGATEPLPPSPKEQPTLEELLTFFHAHSKES
ncbi:hypothetical protein [Microbacterium mitrae]|uniref:hypothetical protein n=1 Tax=Microbacterium mitrae TaxID=664640 RepID=UPI0031E035E3